MKRRVYKVEVQEVLSRTIEIDALTAKSAREKAEQMYKNQQIVLDKSDYIGKSIKIVSK